MAASIGAGLPIDEEYANMIVDIGAELQKLPSSQRLASPISEHKSGWRRIG